MVEKVRPAGLVTAGRGKTKRPLALAAPLPNSQNQTSVQASPLRAAIIGSDECRAEGFSALAASPVLSLCHKLIAAGHDPDQPMQVWRNGTLCLRVRSIGLAAGLEVNTKGTGFIRHRAVRAAPPMHSDGLSGENDRPPCFPSRRAEDQIQQIMAQVFREARK
jgi:hypothetical protein